MMRIITGRARGIKLQTLEGERTRPTSERAKEAIFSMIQFELEGRRVLDLFAGSGQMGLEALSRGASHAVFVDQAKEAIKVVEQNVEKTRMGQDCTVVCGDFADYLRKNQGKIPFDIVFIDPPYAMKAVPAAVEALIRYRALKPTSLLVCESGEPAPISPTSELMSKLRVVKEAVYGKAYVTIYAMANEEQDESNGKDS
jgi:16S rRNA (guanine(966)-N(2))-methyltransferase RsmD